MQRVKKLRLTGYASQPLSVLKFRVFVNRGAKIATLLPMSNVVTEPFPDNHGHLDVDLRRLRKFATVMDTRFEIAGIPFGADAIIGLIPGLGDVLTTGAQLYPLFLANKHDLPRHVQLRMLGNIGLDFLIGLVPIFGDIGDVFFRAARKNVDLFERYARR